jgi:hypothetical protein
MERASRRLQRASTNYEALHEITSVAGLGDPQHPNALAAHQHFISQIFSAVVQAPRFETSSTAVRADHSSFPSLSHQMSTANRLSKNSKKSKTPGRGGALILEPLEPKSRRLQPSSLISSCCHKLPILRTQADVGVVVSELRRLSPFARDEFSIPVLRHLVGSCQVCH